MAFRIAIIKKQKQIKGRKKRKVEKESKSRELIIIEHKIKELIKRKTVPWELNEGFQNTSLLKFRLKQRKFPALNVRIKMVKTKKNGQNLGYDIFVLIYIYIYISMLYQKGYEN